ncbi:MAG: alpha/beta hydrolase [Bacteroidota bacterium]
MILSGSTDSPHKGQPVVHKGMPLSNAVAAMVLVHGRGASAESILDVADELGVNGFAYVAPQAAGNIWYPYRFLAPVEENEPWLSSGLDAIGDVLAEIKQAGIPVERTMLLGFSQGACLALEYAARHPQRFGGVVGLSGGLIGEAPGPYAGSLNDTPVFLGCSDRDPHIPKERVDLSAIMLKELGGNISKVIYPMMDHTINEEEMDIVRGMMIEALQHKIPAHVDGAG